LLALAIISVIGAGCWLSVRGESGVVLGVVAAGGSIRLFTADAEYPRRESSVVSWIQQDTCLV